MTLASDRRLATNPTTEDDVLIRLLGHRDWHVRWNAAQNRGAGDVVRLAALSTGDKDLAWSVAQLGDELSETVREAVFAHPSREGRCALAKITRDRRTQERLASDADYKVRAALFRGKALVDHHPRVPDDIARSLASDARAEVRATVASATTIPDDVALVLATDRSALVREWTLMVRDHDVRFATLLENDPDARIRIHARGVLNRHAASDEEVQSRA